MSYRKELYKRVCEERIHQDNRWGVDFDDKNTVNDWVCYIAKHAGLIGSVEMDKRNIYAGFVKVMALAMAALESAERNGGFPKRHYDK